MTEERRRACGYRKPGGLYLVCDGPGEPCDRLPFPIEPCPCCGYEPKQLRSHQWVPAHYLGDHRVLAVRFIVRHSDLETTRTVSSQRCPDSRAHEGDPICRPPRDPLLLMWVGERYYTPGTFDAEASELGISKRVSEVPAGMVVGRTWILLAHPTASRDGLTAGLRDLFGYGEVLPAPGIFHAFRPTRIELILPESQATQERIKAEYRRGVSVVIIPDGAPDARVSWRPGEERPRLPRQKTIVETVTQEAAGAEEEVE